MKVGVDFIGIGCGVLIVNKHNEVLLLKRSKDSDDDPGTWSRPGGKVEFGETIEAAAERETLEEVGVKVRVVKLLNVSQYIEKGKHWIALGFLAEYISGTPTNMEPDKHDAIGFFPLDKLPDSVNNYTANAIKVYQESLVQRP